MRRYMVKLEDECGMEFYCGWADREKRLLGVSSPPAIFATRAEAETAISASRLYAAYQYTIGEPCNIDWLPKRLLDKGDSPMTAKIVTVEVPA
jgi:hypothetical protein